MTPRAEIQPEEKFPLQLPASPLPFPGTEIQTLLKMAWPWLTKLQRSHCGVMIMQLSRNPPSGICWKSTLWSAGKNNLQESVSPEHFPAKLPEGNARGSCWLPGAAESCVLKADLAPEKLLVLLRRAGPWGSCFCCRSLSPEK